MKPKTWSHPKFAMLKRSLGIGSCMAAGILEGLWHLTATFDAETGGIRFTGEELAAWCEIDIDGQELLDTLVRLRWIDQRDDGLFIHDWQDHKPNYIRDAERKRRWRDTKRQPQSVPGQSRDSHRTSQDNPCAAYPSDSDSDSDSVSDKKQEKKERSLSRSSRDGGWDITTAKGGSLSREEIRTATDLVIAHYKTHHQRSCPGDKERTLIRARLKEGRTVADLRDAIDGCHDSPHHSGQNDAGRKYQSISLIFRDASHVDQFIELVGSHEDNGQSEAEAQMDNIKAQLTRDAK